MLDSRIIDDRAQAMAREFDAVTVSAYGGTAILTAYDHGQKRRTEVWDTATERCVHGVDVQEVYFR